MSSTKPFAIAKRSVWEAYQQVKANRGAAGIDDETIAMFEQDLGSQVDAVGEQNRLHGPQEMLGFGSAFVVHGMA